MFLPVHNIWSTLTLMGLITALCASSSLFGGSLTVSDGATTFTGRTVIDTGTSTLLKTVAPVTTGSLTFAFPGAPLPGFAGLPLVVSAAQVITGPFTPVSPNPVVPNFPPFTTKPTGTVTLIPSPLSGSLSAAPNSAGGTVTLAGATTTGLVAGTASVAGGTLTLASNTNGAVSITTQGSSQLNFIGNVTTSGLSANGGVITAGNTSLTTSGNGTLTISGATANGAGLILANNTAGNGTINLSGTTGSTFTSTTAGNGTVQLSGTPLSGVGLTLAGNTTNYQEAGGLEIVSITNSFLYPPVYNLTNPTQLPVDLGLAIDTASPGTAFSDTNTPDSITSSTSGATFPNGTNIRVTSIAGGAPSTQLVCLSGLITALSEISFTHTVTLVNQTGEDLVITPSATIAGGLLISVPTPAAP